VNIAKLFKDLHMVVQKHKTDEEMNASSMVWILLYFAAKWQDPGSEKVLCESLSESTNVTSRITDFTKNNPNVYIT
jgi:hypothetical protein